MLQCIPLFALAVLFVNDDLWFVILSVYLTAAVFFFALRTAHAPQGRWWRISLFVVLTISLGTGLLLVLSMPGETKLCLPRYVKTHPWSPMKELPPHPSCQGKWL
jgi:hypothetical protein